MTATRQAVIVGAGISGLSCAIKLTELGVNVRVLEAAGEPGGMVSTIERHGFLFEAGPQSFQMTAELQQLIRMADCEAELVEADPRTPRYVLLHGKLHPAPMSPPQLLTTSLLGTGSKVRLFSEPFRHTKPPDGDESLADFVRRKFGTELLEHLAGPFVSGVYAGDPELLSMRSTFPSLALWEQEYGSVIRGAMKSRSESQRVEPTLAGFQHGMTSLLKAMGGKIARGLALDIRAQSLEPAEGSKWKIRCTGKDQPGEVGAEVVVLATPAYEAARLTENLGDGLKTALSSIPYAPVAVVAEGYRREYVGHALDGFGFLVPRSEGLRTLGNVWNSSLFPGRAPEDAVAITSFVGGALDPKIVSMDEGQIANQVRDEIGRVLEISGPPMERQVWQHHRALPQYNVGHSHRVAIIREELEKRRGLFITGNYLEGPSMGSCVAQGFQTAEAVRNYLAC